MALTCFVLGRKPTDPGRPRNSGTFGGTKTALHRLPCEGHQRIGLGAVQAPVLRLLQPAAAAPQAQAGQHRQAADVSSHPSPRARAPPRRRCAACRAWRAAGRAGRWPRPAAPALRRLPPLGMRPTMASWAMSTTSTSLSAGTDTNAVIPSGEVRFGCGLPTSIRLNLLVGSPVNDREEGVLGMEQQAVAPVTRLEGRGDRRLAHRHGLEHGHRLGVEHDVGVRDGRLHPHHLAVWETRSMYGLLPAGKLTVWTIWRVARSILETVSWSRSGIKPNRPSGVKCRSQGNLPVLIWSSDLPVARSSTASESSPATLTHACLAVGGEHQAMRGARAAGGEVRATADRVRVDSDRLHRVVGEVVGPDVAPVPELAAHWTASAPRAERLGGKHLLRGGVEEGDILRLGVEGVAHQPGLGGLRLRRRQRPQGQRGGAAPAAWSTRRRPGRSAPGSGERVGPSGAAGTARVAARLAAQSYGLQWAGRRAVSSGLSNGPYPDLPRGCAR